MSAEQSFWSHFDDRSTTWRDGGPPQRRALMLAITLPGAIAFLTACAALQPRTGPLTASLRTDSTEIGVTFRMDAYVANIGFVYTNNTPGPLSKSHCSGPADPLLEKNVNGRWVPAYLPFYLMCRTTPDFRIESGGAHRGVIRFVAYEPGRNKAPELRVASIDGTYRLRWIFAEGTEDTESARRVEAISNEFRMVLRPSAVVRLRAEPYSFEFHSGLDRAMRTVVRDRGTWETLWARIYDRRSPVPPAPDIDFSREMFIVAALGARATGGYGILIDGVSTERDTLVIAVRSISPGPQCGVIAAATQPVDIALLPRNDGPVRFLERSEIKDCK